MSFLHQTKTVIRSILTFLVFVSNIVEVVAEELLLFRSEYEAVGDLIGYVGGLEGSGEQALTYVCLQGAEFFVVDAQTGAITVREPIEDTHGVVSTVRLSVRIDGGAAGVVVREVCIVDGYDYTVQANPKMRLLSGKDGRRQDGAWFAHNNLWAAGRLAPDQDFRIGMLLGEHLPGGVIWIWDVPGVQAEVHKERGYTSGFSPSNMYNYSNLMLGNRIGFNENATGFPFRIDEIDSFAIDYHIEKLFGGDEFKMMFQVYAHPEKKTLKSLKEISTDFLFIFDQKGTWIPPYRKIQDVVMHGEDFAAVYQEAVDDHLNLRRERLIVKNHQALYRASFDLRSMFGWFAEKSGKDLTESFSYINLGIEVSDGFGAVELKQLEVDVVSGGERYSY